MYWTLPICQTTPNWSLDDLQPFMFQDSMKALLLEQSQREDNPEIPAEPFPKEQKAEVSGHDAAAAAAVEDVQCKKRLSYVKKCQDPLFWSLFLAHYGETEYRRVGRHNGNVEMDEKKKVAECFYKKGSKEVSVVLNTKITKAACGRLVEDILTLPKTSLGCVMAYCVYYQCSIYLVDLKKKIYLPYIHSAAEQTVVLYKNADEKWPAYYIDTEQQLHTLEYLTMHCMCLNSYEKPLKSASGYKLSDLQSMACLMNIDCDAKLKKNELYEKIVLHCVPDF